MLGRWARVKSLSHSREHDRPTGVTAGIGSFTLRYGRGPVQPAIVTAPYAPDVNRLRRRLRGLPHSILFQTLQELLETWSVPALAADNSGRYVAANPAVATLTGYSRDELLRMSVKDLTPAMREDTAAELWKRFIQTGSQSGDYVLVRKDGAPVSVHYAAYASVAPGVHISVLAPLDVPSSI